MNYLTADMDYTRANDVLSVKGIELLQKRQKEIVLKEAGDWVERTGLVETVRGLTQLSIMTSNYFAANSIKLAKKSPKIKDTKVKGAGKADKTLSNLEAEENAFNAIKGSNKADEVVLGKFDGGGPTSYSEVAKNMDAQYFELDNWDELASMYSDNEIWKINEKFLDMQTSSGRDIFLSHNPAEHINTNSFYAKELQYLVNNGYGFKQIEGGIWYAYR